MGVASLVIGLVSFFVSLIPLCGYVASIPAITGLILGIVYLVQAKKREDSNKGIGIAGVVFNMIALVILGIYSIAFAIFGGTQDTVKDFFSDALSDSAQVEHDSIKNEIESELAGDSSNAEPNPFEMNDSEEQSPSENVSPEGNSEDTSTNAAESVVAD